MPEQLQKAINLAKRTGDRIIVFNSFKAEDAFVIMNLDDYDKMLDSREEIRSLTEDELLDRINRDVALWRNDSGQSNEALPENDIWQQTPPNSAPFIPSSRDQDMPFDVAHEQEDSFGSTQDENLYYYEDPLVNLELDDKDSLFKEDDDVMESGNNFLRDFEDNSKKNNWRIPSGIKEAADEVIEDVPFKE